MEPMELFVKDDTGDYQPYEVPSFNNQLPEDLRADDRLSGIENLEGLARTYLDAHDKLPVVPESAEGYKIDVPEGIRGDDQALAGFRTLAHEIGLTQAQLEKIAAFDFERAKKYDEAYKSARVRAKQDAENQLKDLWKTDYDSNMATASRAVRMFMDAETEKRLGEAGLLDNADITRVFHEIGKKISEDTFHPGRPAPPTGVQRGADGRPMLSFPSME